MRIRPISLVVSALLLTLASVAAPQTATAPSSPPAPTAAQPGAESNIPSAGFDVSESNTPTIRVSAREVFVDVLVTDASGKPVHGLKASDFAVQENGKPQAIRSFYESATAAPQKIKPSPQSPGLYDNGRYLPAGGPVTIFLIDALNGRAQPTRWIVSYLHDMPSGTRVGIFYISASGLHALKEVTTDRDILVYSLNNHTYDREDLAPVNEPARRSATLRAFNELSAYLSGIRGRKSLFWLTASVPVLLMHDGGLAMGTDQRSKDMRLVHETMDTYQMLTDARIAVYPVISVGAARDITSEAQRIADDFGSKVVDTTDRSGLAKTLDEASEYYSLSYLPPKEEIDGHYNCLSVAVDKPGLTLNYRRGYNSQRAPTIDDPSPGRGVVEASMGSDFLPATQFLFDSAIQPAPPASTAATKLPTGLTKPANSSNALPPKTIPYLILYRFPASEVAFTQDEPRRLHGALEFHVVAYGGTAIPFSPVATLTQTVNITLPIDQFDQFANHPLALTQEIDLPPGQLWIRVGILDTVSNHIGTLQFPVQVGKWTPLRIPPGTPISWPSSDFYQNPLPCMIPCTTGLGVEPYPPDLPR